MLLPAIPIKGGIFVKRTALIITAVIMLLSLFNGCAAEKTPSNSLPQLPVSDADPDSQFGVDKNINMSTIDSWLHRDDVVYRDMRMLFDPADYGSIGGEADLTRTIEGFKIVPYPYLATLSALPVANAYQGDNLFKAEWTEDGRIVSAEPKYRESMMILEELFPKDKAIFLMCGGGGYAGMTKQLLVYLGWDESLLYNVGANWTYQGKYALELVVYPEDAREANIYATWRADYAYIDFARLQPTGQLP